MRISKAIAFPAGSVPIYIARMNPQPDMGLHSHDFTELVLVLRGNGLHLTGGATYPIKAGDAFVITGQRRHGFRDTSQLVLANVLYDPEGLAMPLRQLREVPGYHVLFTMEPAYHKRHGFANRVRLALSQLSLVCGWVDTLERELTERAPGFRFVATAILMQIVAFVSRAYAQSPPRASAELMRIAHAISHLERSYQQRVALQDLAGIAHMSRRSFTRVFRAVTGHSPIDYLIHFRLAQAAQLLRGGEKRITDVAFATGFQDGNYFTRQFRRVFGLSPREFRRRGGLREAASQAT
jgi:AraC-like DNA-binding protein